MSFINNDFLLQSETAKRLYHDYAENMPIIDYHCHLSPQMIAEDYSFSNIGELMLGGDHYKWRVMRSNGIDEKYITGDAPDFEKFEKFAECMPYCIGNPMLHWTQLELKRYFGIDEILCNETAKTIWDKCNALLSEPEFSVRGLIKKSNVKVICTTDDPKDSLEYHKKIAESGFETKILPTFRPDKAVDIEKDTFIPYVKELGITTYDELLAWMESKILFFNDNGCRVSDHALEYVPFGTGCPEKAFDKRLRGESLTPEETDSFKTSVIKHCAMLYTRLGWTMQLHIGALRNNNSAMFEKLGPDTGFDTINDLCIAEKLSKFLDCLEKDGVLPKTILYTLNPKDNYVLGAMIGCFQKAPTPGKIQFGSGWWFNDQKDGMETQMKALGNLGMLGRFVGMLTDSRSFVSYTRHEYFRRILCNLVGSWVEEGQYPDDDAMLEMIIKGICYNNADRYFGF